MFNYSVLCNARLHRIDIFVELGNTKQNFYVFRNIGATNLTLSSDYRSKVANSFNILETLLVGELAPRSFGYVGGRSSAGRHSCFVQITLCHRRFALVTIQKNLRVSMGTATEGGIFYLFSVSNFLNDQTQPQNTLVLSLERLSSEADPHFKSVRPISNAVNFYNYGDPISPVNQIVFKLERAFVLFDDMLFKLLDDAGFRRPI